MGKFDLTDTPITEDGIAMREEAQGLRDNVIARSFRGGVYGAGSQLSSLGGLAAETMGMEQPAASLRNQSASLRAQAALPQNAPRVASYRDVGSLRDAGEYVGGLMGGSLPYMGVGLAGALATGGAGVIPGMLGAAAALTPFEAGDVVQKQEADPVAMQDGSGDRLRNAVVAGGASALAQGIVPGGLAGRIAGKAVGKPLGSITGNVLTEGAAEGAGETIKQLGANMDAPLDTTAILDNAIGGAVAGGAFGAAGAGVDAVRGVAPGIKSTINERAAAAKAKLTPSAAAEPEAETEPKVRTAMDDLNDLAARGKEKFDDSLDRVINGQPLGDLKEFATAQGERLTEMANFSENETVRKATEWAKEMLEDKGLTPERRQAVADAMANVKDRASQVTIATAKKAWDMGREAASKVDAFYESAKGLANLTGVTRDVQDAMKSAKGLANLTGVTGDVESAMKSAKGLANLTGVTRDLNNLKDKVKKSEDYSGAVKTIVADIVPILQKSQPQLLENAGAINKLADGLRMTIADIQKGPLSSDRIASLIDVLGPDTATVLAKLQERFVTENPAKTEAFFKQVNDIVEVQKRGNDLNELVGKSLTPEMQESVPTSEIPKIVQGLREFLQKDRGGDAQRSFFDGVFRREMQRYFGPHADKVSKALEKDMLDNQREEDSAESAVDDEGNMIESDSGTPRGQGPLYDEQGTRIEAAEPDAKVFGLTAPDKKGNSKSRRNGRAMLAPDIAAARGEKSYAAQHLADLKGQFPQHKVYFRRLPGSEYGHVVVKAGDPLGRFNDTEVSEMKLDTGRFANSPNRLDVGGEILDSARIASATARNNSDKFEPEGKQTRAEWLADQFKQGIARLTEQYGTVIEVPDRAVIGYIGGDPLTWGEAKKIVPDTAEDRSGGNRTSDEAVSRLNDLRETYARATWNDRKLQAAALKRLVLSDKELDELRAEAKQITDSMERDRVREMLTGDEKGSPRARQMSKVEKFNDALAEEGMNAKQRGAIARRSDRGPRPFEQNDARFDEDGKLTAAGVQELLAGDADGGINVLDAKWRTASRERDDLSLRAEKRGSPEDKGVRQQNRDLQDAFNSRERDKGKSNDGQGRSEVGKDENIHLVEAAVGEGDMTVRSNMDGTPHDAPSTYTSKELGKARNILIAKAGEWARVQSEASRRIAKRLQTLLNDIHSMAEADQLKLRTLALKDAEGLTAAKAADVVNELAKKYAGSIMAPGERATDQVPDKGPIQKNPIRFKDGKKDNAAMELEYKLEGYAEETAAEGTPDPKAVAAKKAAFLAKAASGDKGLLGELKKSTDAKGLQRAAKALNDHTFEGVSENDQTAENVMEVIDTINARLRELVQDPDVAYGLQTKRYSQQSTNPGAQGPVNRAAVEAYLNRVLGASVRRAWANLTHAGEFDSVANVIRISIHALNPLSVAHHEALHAFFKQLRDQGATDITEAVMKAANSPHVIAQLQAFFANEPGVLGQLSDPEERAAYMYQMWAAKVPGFTLGAPVRTRFQKIAKYIRDLLGIWSNDERALHILEYFDRGDYAQAAGSPNAVYRAMMAPGRNKAVDALQGLSKPLLELAEALVATGSGRLRDTGIPALQELADIIKRDATEEGGDQGFIQAARVEATKRRTAMAKALADFTPEQLQEAQDALQRNVPAATPEARLAVRAIKELLRDTRDYMVAGGVDVGNLGPDYYPRVWDIHYISKNLPAFRMMLDTYVRNGQMQGDPDDFIARLMSRDGNEFGIETRRPGMQHAKVRLLDFITAADAAEFVTKDLFGTLNSYITQAARRTEWERRLGGNRLDALFIRAKVEGATDKQLEMADEYLRGVDGTLGDSLNPQARRIMGNMIVYQNIRLLPLAMFSSIVDPMGVIVRGGTVKDAWATFKRGIREIPESYGKKATPDEMTKLAETLGVIDTAILNHTMGDLYTQGMVGGTAQKINNAFFRLNLMEGLNRSFRVGATEAALKFLQTHAGNNASTHSTRWLRELGLRQGDIITMPNGRIALSAADGLTQAQMVRVHAAINQWVDGAVLRPDAADKPIWMNDPHFALISHLKQFTYAFQKTIIGRVVHEFEQGNLKPAMALASYVPVMIGADFIKGLLQGGGDQPEWKQSWTAADYIGHGIQRAGLLGVGQFGWDAADDLQEGGIGAGALVGPTIEQFIDAVQVLGGSKEFAPVMLKALPANALYKDSVAEAGT